MKTTMIRFWTCTLLIAVFTACGGKDDPPNPENGNENGNENENENGGENGGENSDPSIGTSANPFKVATIADLRRVASGEEEQGGIWSEDKYYLQTADIDLSAVENWKPICGKSVAKSFSGTYDGGGNTISHIKITALENGYDAIGLFGYNNGTIKNVRMINGGMTVLNGEAHAFGGIVGMMESGTIDHCFVSDIEMIVLVSSFGIGGVVGSVSRSGIVSNCIVTNTTISTTALCGGIAGDISDGGIIENCFSTANVMGKNAGGIAGTISEDGIVRYCYATGNINASTGWAGGIAGYNMASTIQNCVALNPKVQSNPHVGRIVGEKFMSALGKESMMFNNYARHDMILISNYQNFPVNDISLTNIHGDNVTEDNYEGENSETWWSNTAGFPEEAWDFAPNRLPHLKGFDKLTQNPTVTP